MMGKKCRSGVGQHEGQGVRGAARETEGNKFFLAYCKKKKKKKNWHKCDVLFR